MHFFSLGDPAATQTKCYVSEGVSIDCGSAYCQEILGLFHFIMTFFGITFPKYILYKKFQLLLLLPVITIRILDA